MNNHAGKYKSNLSGELAYKSFVPNPLPPSPKIELTKEIVDTLVKVSNKLTFLESMVSYVPDVNLFISMYVRKEALLSSQIEGTQATLEDIFDPMIDSNVGGDIGDVIKYIKAMEFAIKKLEDLPLCNRLIKETHAILMEGVRGHDKCPGEFRSSQNWIGGIGSTIKNARYIPPEPEDMKNAMFDLENYINSDDDLHPLIQAALIHYQFETIHPFLDGNGRLGRLLVTLFLINKNIIASPILYVSYFLKKNRVEYYDRMTEVRNKGDYEQWVLFFLQAILESVEDEIESINKLIDLRNKNSLLISRMGRASSNVLKVFNYLEANPIIEINIVSKNIGIAFNTAANIVKRLVDIGILKQVDNVNRNRVFVYEKYLDILREGTQQ